MIKKSKKIHHSTADQYQIGRTLSNNSNATNTHDEINEVKSGRRLSKKRLFAIFTAIGLAAAMLYGWAAWDRINQAFNGSLFDFISKNEPLERDSFGRSNIVVFGTSEDDDGHSGATLADSILVISVNQDSFNANMVSIPRDLWVKLNSKCSLGAEQKINASYACALDANNGDEQAASKAFAQQVSEVIGTDIHYYAKINYSVVRSVVDSLGGIEVEINSNDPRGIYDPATKIKFANGTHRIDGQTALDLSRSRGAFGGYGFSLSNFDRERNQQAVVQGILAKATSTGTLSNPSKVLSVFGSLGENITSNIEAKNIKTISKIASSVDASNVVSLRLNEKERPLVTTGSYRGVSIVKPTKGIFDYSEIHKYITDNFTLSSSNNESIPDQ